MDRKTVLMTGHFGFIGKILWPRLAEMGFELRGYDKAENGEDNILDTNRLAERLIGANVCLHLAGIPGPWGLPWQEYEQNNVKGTLSVIDACLKAGVDKIVYMSSCAVYGVTTGACKPITLPLKEANPLPKFSEIDFYDKSKILCEKHLEKATKKHGITVVALRIDTILPHSPILETHMYASVTEENLADGVRAAINASFSGRFGAFNIVDTSIKINSGTDFKQLAAEKFPGVPNNLASSTDAWIDSTKAQKLLGYNPR